jgi:deazaflavin-dependent oxidoreductase (nitroreductase family)
MVLSRRIARWNNVGLNRLTRRFAGRVPLFALVEHVGRRSGTSYRTPVNVFRAGDEFVVALTYGPNAEWVKNVRAAGGCRLRTRGRWYDLTDPRLVHDRSRQHVPSPFRQVLARAHVHEFLYLRLHTSANG